MTGKPSCEAKGSARAARTTGRLLGAAFAGLAAVAPAGEREQAVCNRVLEPLAFWLWNRSAGTPRLLEAGVPAGIEAIEYTTADGRVLRGFRIPAAAPRKGFLLVAQGNATLAERLLAYLGDYARAGYVVIVYDYRGYANSGGRRRLKAIVEDYREIHAALVRDVPGERLLYGMSFGGIVLLNVIGAGAPFDRAVIDSTPSRIASFGCPERYDPVANLPADAARLLLVNGARDRVVAAADSAELLNTAAARGARTVRSPEFDHPFMDRDLRVHEQRQALIRAFLLERGP
jgi:alpha-beta hydrolase superfamily lysophospholipase